MMKAAFTIGCLLLAGCARHYPQPTALPGAAILPLESTPASFAVLSPTSGTIGYSGSITTVGFDALKSADNESVHTLLIRSSRGNLEVGIAMGEWVHARHLDVVVVDYCALGCANYVFTAAQHKTILPGAVVAWNGDARGGGLAKALAKGGDSPEAIAKLRAEEDALFAKIGVSECVTRFGDERGFMRDLGRAYAMRQPIHYFTLSAEDMSRFGVTDVSATAGDVNPGVRKWLDITFEKVPADVDARTACK